VDALTNVATDPASTTYIGAIVSDPNLAGALDNVSGSRHPQTNYQGVQDTQNALDLVLNHLAGGGISAPITGLNFSRDGLRFASLGGSSDVPCRASRIPHKILSA